MMHYLPYKNIRALEHANISKEFIEEIKNPLVFADVEYIIQDWKNCDKIKRKEWFRLCPEKNFPHEIDYTDYMFNSKPRRYTSCKKLNCDQAHMKNSILHYRNLKN